MLENLCMNSFFDPKDNYCLNSWAAKAKCSEEGKMAVRQAGDDWKKVDTKNDPILDSTQIGTFKCVDENARFNDENIWIN